MPFCDRFIAVLGLIVILSLPAFADGTPGKPVNRGPVPVKAHKMVPPEPGCYIIEDELGPAWSCPARKTVAPHPTPLVTKTKTSTPCCGTVTRTIVKEHPPVVTKRIVTHRKAPTTRTVTRTHTRHPVRTVQRVETSAVQLDMGSFTGGVGAGVGGDFYGGGGAVIITGSKRYSGVMSHSASSYTFRSHRSYRGGGKKRRGGGGGCGC